MTSYQPMYVGQTYPTWQLPLARDGGTEDISAVDITTFKLYFRTSGGIETQGQGTITAAAYNPASIYYKPVQSDVAVPFTGYIIIKAFYPPSGTNADEVVFDPIGGIGNTNSTPVPFVISAS